MPDHPPTLDYRRPEPQRRLYLSTFGKAVLIIVVAAIVLSIFIPLPHTRRAMAERIMCASNLRQIGQAISLYAQDNNGAFPADLPMLANSPSVPGMGLALFVCRGSADTEATSLAQLPQPGHCSYIYVGADLSSKDNPQCIVALEDPAHHALKGGNVLFADGHIIFVDMPTLIQILTDLAAGTNPSTSKATLSQGAAEKAYELTWRRRMPQLKTGVWLIPTTRPKPLPE